MFPILAATIEQLACEIFTAPSYIVIIRYLVLSFRPFLDIVLQSRIYKFKVKVNFKVKKFFYFIFKISSFVFDSLAKYVRLVNFINFDL